jgi:hypothetical protein
VEVGIPELDLGLVLPPPFVDEKTVDNAGPVIASSSFLSGLDDLLGYDSTVWPSDLLLLELARNAFFDQMAEFECDLRHIRCRNGRFDRLVDVCREDWRVKELLVSFLLDMTANYYSRRRRDSRHHWLLWSWLGCLSQPKRRPKPNVLVISSCSAADPARKIRVAKEHSSIRTRRQAGKGLTE